MKLGLPIIDKAEQERLAAGQPAPADGELLPGHILDRRFAITGIITQGGMATIYKADDLETGKPVAIKLPIVKLGMITDLIDRFEREEEIGLHLDHPYVMKFLAPGPDKSRPYIATEFLDGHTLNDELKDRTRLPEAEALALASRICEALDHIHERGIIHRDLKPENIMLCRDGTIRLMDFGIARAAEWRKMTFISFAPGTPHYMAPERIQRKSGDARTDIYSLGAILYQMLTGVIAFDHEDVMFIMNCRVTGDPEAPRKLNPQISPQAEEIVLRAMSRDLDDRYSTAAAMKADLDAPAQVKVTGRCDRLVPTTRFRRAMRQARLAAPWIIIPIVLQVVGFLLLWHFFAKK